MPVSVDGADCLENTSGSIGGHHGIKAVYTRAKRIRSPGELALSLSVEIFIIVATLTREKDLIAIGTILPSEITGQRCHC